MPFCFFHLYRTFLIIDIGLYFLGRINSKRERRWFLACFFLRKGTASNAGNFMSSARSFGRGLEQLGHFSHFISNNKIIILYFSHYTLV
jgi:hypothetical protein